jgi:phytoene dehydrogenase-like protein
MSEGVIIIGAGLAGLCCGIVLQRAGVPFVILEAADAVGGRIRTDRQDGFLLDRGFQIFLSAYPEARSLLNYESLDLRPFYPGAVVRSAGRFHRVADPAREPLAAVQTLCAPVGTFADKLRVADLRHKLLSTARTADLLAARSTIVALKERGFSEAMISKFFRPFLGGIFLDQNLETSAGMFEFVFEMLARGDNTLPAQGMQAIPEQLAKLLPAETIRLSSSVVSIDGNKVTLANGEQLRGFAVVLATDELYCQKLLRQKPSARYKSQTCVYFAAPEAPFAEPLLVLNGEGEGIVLNLTVPSNVSRSYAPAGTALISAVVTGDPSMADQVLEEAIRAQMTDWYGQQVSKWKHLRTYRIKYALPDQSPEALAERQKSYKQMASLYFCGDYKEGATINGAMVSGRKAAEAVLRDLKLSVA